MHKLDDSANDQESSNEEERGGEQYALEHIAIQERAAVAPTVDTEARSELGSR
jgi:hypothetical protein